MQKCRNAEQGAAVETIHTYEQNLGHGDSVPNKGQEPGVVLNGVASHFPILFWSFIFLKFPFIGLRVGPSLGVLLRIQAIDIYFSFQQGEGRSENVLPSEIA